MVKECKVCKTSCDDDARFCSKCGCRHGGGGQPAGAGGRAVQPVGGAPAAPSPAPAVEPPAPAVEPAAPVVSEAERSAVLCEQAPKKVKKAPKEVRPAEAVWGASLLPKAVHFMDLNEAKQACCVRRAAALYKSPGSEKWRSWFESQNPKVIDLSWGEGENNYPTGGTDSHFKAVVQEQGLRFLHLWRSYNCKTNRPRAETGGFKEKATSAAAADEARALRQRQFTTNQRVDILPTNPESGALRCANVIEVKTDLDGNDIVMFKYLDNGNTDFLPTSSPNLQPHDNLRVYQIGEDVLVKRNEKWEHGIILDKKSFGDDCAIRVNLEATNEIDTITTMENIAKSFCDHCIRRNKSTAHNGSCPNASTAAQRKAGDTPPVRKTGREGDEVDSEGEVQPRPKRSKQEQKGKDKKQKEQKDAKGGGKGSKAGGKKGGKAGGK
eukprot:TRINITY_DN39424_c0_g1_i1.p1 TRINITY_DN39424_c0_g1~~TRINITY_DN39424_c0_g1_i1.p1  ORF type:complete len:466 (+),score=158.80 TRINITY_DN39424_c0_g1_i1:85-1398(+)